MINITKLTFMHLTKETIACFEAQYIGQTIESLKPATELTLTTAPPRPFLCLPIKSIAFNEQLIEAFCIEKITY